MKTTGIYTTHKYIIDVEDWNKPFYLIPVGDIHRNSPLCAVDRFKSFCAWARPRKDCYYIGTGDWLDLLSTSERKNIKIPDLHESTVSSIEDMYNYHINKLVDEVSFMKGRIIGLIGGNHYVVFGSSITSDQKMCELLETKFLGVCAFIRVIFKDKHKHSAKVDIYIHHGRSGGRTVGASAGKLEHSMKGKLADIYIQGHSHDKLAIPKSRLMLTESRKELKVIQKKVFLIRSGGFLKGYVDGKKSYVAEGDYNPTDIGVVKIILTPKRDSEDNRYIDIHASL